MFAAKPIAEKCGFKFWKPLVWDTQYIGMGYHYRARYEFILFFEKGKRKLHDLGIADVISEKRIARGYPTEKPSTIAELLIKQSSSQGDLVVDCFAGSGSTGEAALKLGRRFIGNDKKQSAADLCIKRLCNLNLGE
ncbi:N6-methyltransferase [Aggregatibacter actinomycetemcomitans serotype f str. SC29R]|nr:N6-methyltransferase [Aggregatibacter actinomycetemcomitans serotype e str. SA2876]KYK87320.1 N6-methyltransferase [Aggregatibacter actinomycetemcomitans serotype f str. SC29R]